MTTLVLASASPARLRTLTDAGIGARVLVSNVDEQAVLTAGFERFGPLEPAEQVLLLARAKAEDVAERLWDEVAADDAAGEEPEEGTQRDGAGDVVGGQGLDVVVLGCDSMLEMDGAVLGKPADAAEATVRIRAMSGRSPVLHTGHWLIDLREADAGGTGGTLGATASTTVHFTELTDAEIEAYVATGEPLGVAGSFTIDGLGGPFVAGVDGDHHNVVGLSLPLLRELLGAIDLPITALWTR